MDREVSAAHFHVAIHSARYSKIVDIANSHIWFGNLLLDIYVYVIFTILKNVIE